MLTPTATDLALTYDVFLPMGYFSYRPTDLGGAYGYTVRNARLLAGLPLREGACLRVRIFPSGDANVGYHSRELELVRVCSREGWPKRGVAAR
jgi:hypothetical protein